HRLMHSVLPLRTSRPIAADVEKGFALEEDLARPAEISRPRKAMTLVSAVPRTSPAERPNTRPDRFVRPRKRNNSRQRF
nr:hypothetical protein [Longispora sp. (in: high G+C Gram-positive bacteria)]